jgi:glycosyltransferase involved in cell wall biosynthesis
MRPLISVVICTYNRAETLRRSLEAVIHQDIHEEFSYEVVVIDDGSTDGTSAVVKEAAIRASMPVRYVHKQGGGIADSRNRGVKESRGEWIAFCDDDELAEQDWLKALYNVALQRGAVCVGGSIRLDLPQETLLCLGPVCRGLLSEYLHYDKVDICREKVIPCTGNILFSHRILDSIGGFDASMIYGGEDSDILGRIRLAGYDIWIVPNAVVRHLVPPYRLDATYFRWVSLRQGALYAEIDRKHRGSLKMLFLCAARLGQALLVNMPHLLGSYATRCSTEVLDCKCLLWKAEGYLRESLRILAPSIFSQKHFFEQLEFRRDRAAFQKHLRKPPEDVDTSER